MSEGTDRTSTRECGRTHDNHGLACGPCGEVEKDLCHSERSIKNQVWRHKKVEIPDMADRYFDGGSKNACPHFDALESWIS